MCGFVIGEGSPNVFAGAPPASCHGLAVGSEIPEDLENAVDTAGKWGGYLELAGGFVMGGPAILNAFKSVASVLSLGGRHGHWGHLVPEQGVDHPGMVNTRENLISEAPSSNLSAKKIFENRAVAEADNNPNSTIYTRHEPSHNPGEMRPYEVTHSIEKDGTIIHTVTIPNQ